MIIKGNRHNNGVKLARYITTGKEGERAELAELHGFASENIVDAFRDVHNMADANGIKNPFFHVHIRLPEGEAITPEQWKRTTDATLTRLGLTGQPYAVTFHIDETTGEKHAHMAISLIDQETMRAKPVPFFKRRLPALARELETEFDITRVKNNREGPIKYGATKNEERQAERLGFDKEAVRNTIRHCWERADCGQSFEAELADAGLILAQGNRRDYVVIDPKGGVHALGKRILDAPAKQVREKLADLDRENIPTVEHAREFLLDLPRDRADKLTREIAELQKQIEAEREYARAPEAPPQPDIAALLKRELAEVDKLLYGGFMPAEQKRELADLDKFLAAELYERQKKDPAHFKAHWQDQIPPAIAAEIEKLSAAEAERDYANRDPAREEMKWLDEVAKAAIEKEKIECRFVEPEQKEPRRAQGQKKEQPQKRSEPELGETQAQIRFARVLTPGPQSFANALEDRGFILARVTDTDIQKDLEKLLKEWEDRHRDPQSWMEHESGYAKLKAEFQESARRSFDEWRQQNQPDQPDQRQRKPFAPDAYLSRIQREWAETLRQPPPTDKGDLEDEAYKHQLENYVRFVQKKWAEVPKSRLERAAGGLAVVTPFGSVYTLTPRNTGLSRAELPDYLKGIDRAPLLSVTDAQAVMEDAREHRRAEWQHQQEERQMQQPVGATAAGIRLAYSLTQTGPEFAAALEDRGLILVSMTEADAERLNRWERQRLREARAAEPPAKEGEKPRKERDIESYEKYHAGELAVINQYGSAFQLTAATTGAHAAERNERLKEIDRAPLLSVTDAQAAMRDYQQHQRQEWRQQRDDAYRHGLNEKLSPVSPPQPERKSKGLFKQAATEAARDDRTENLTGLALQVWTAYRQSGNEYCFEATGDTNSVHSVRTGNREVFTAALDEKGIGFAITTKDEAERSHRAAEFAKEIGNYAPRFKQGEIVIVTAPRLERRRDGEITEARRVYKLDQSLAAKFVDALGTRSGLKGIETTKQALTDRAKERADKWESIRLKNATRKHGGRSNGRMGEAAVSNLARPLGTAAQASRHALGAFGGALSKLADGFSLDALTPKEKYEAAKRDARNEHEADTNAGYAEYMAALAEQRRQDQQRQAEQKEREPQRER